MINGTALAACYTFYPKADMPIKVIVLDDTDKMDCGPYGCLDEPRYNWLINELESGQAADELMIICSHIPVWPYGYQSPPTKIIWNPDSYVSDQDLVNTISQHLFKRRLVDRGTCPPQRHHSTSLMPLIPDRDTASGKSRPHR